MKGAHKRRDEASRGQARQAGVPSVRKALELPKGASAGIQCVVTDPDGRRVRVEALDEIVIQCGKASITLRRNGKVIVKGVYVETHAEGTNRIKGGQVRLN